MFYRECVLSMLLKKEMCLQCHWFKNSKIGNENANVWQKTFIFGVMFYAVYNVHIGCKYQYNGICTDFTENETVCVG